MKEWLSPDDVASPYNSRWLESQNNQSKLRMDKNSILKDKRVTLDDDRDQLDKWIESHMVVRAV